MIRFRRRSFDYWNRADYDTIIDIADYAVIRFEKHVRT